MLRPELPFVPSAGLANASDVEPAFDHFIARPAAIELGVADQIRAIVGETVEIAVLPGADGERVPVCSVTMAETVQSWASRLSSDVESCK